MSEYLSEEEQVEALKKWWKDNGRSVIAGVVIGLGVVFGWQSWVQYRHGQMESAANRFTQLHDATQAGEIETAKKTSELLQQEHGTTVYAAFAELDLAKLLIEQGDSAGAKSALQKVIDQAKAPALADVARVRLARLQLGLGETDPAAQTLAQIKGAAFAGEAAEIRGDIARTRNDLDAARAAYSDALAKEVGNSMVVRMKLQDIGGDPAQAEAAKS